MHAPSGWSAVVPLKRPSSAKQRLLGLGEWRPALAVAFATDVVTALLESDVVGVVLIVGGDGLPPSLLARPGVHQVPDVRGLNPAVESGVLAARRQAQVGLLVVPADLPSLRPEDVEALVRATPRDRAAALADADGDGTAALVIPSGVDLAPAFGPSSYARHLDAGAVPVTDELPSARRDVDTVEHLRAARALGLGRETTRVLAQRAMIETLRTAEPSTSR